MRPIGPVLRVALGDASFFEWLEAHGGEMQRRARAHHLLHEVVACDVVARVEAEEI